MSLDKRALEALIEKSDDVQSDAMRATKQQLTELVDYGRDRRARGGYEPEESRRFQAERRRLIIKGLSGAGVVAGTAFGAGLLGLFDQPAFADTPMDIQAAQTAASIENLAIAVYHKAAGLPFMQNIPDPAGSTVKAFVTKTVQQHTDHAGAFNAAARALGGKEQTGVDLPVYNGVVTPALGTLKSPLDVVNFAAKLELVAAETYSAETAAVSDKNLRNTFASIMGVESQHVSILLAVAALLEAGATSLIKLGPPADQLPAAAGSVGFPDSFLKTDMARPATEGAVQ
ncbi:MAG TPA: ferritin-like domain-containing protein [Acidimicrobiales bacterium]